MFNLKSLLLKKVDEQPETSCVLNLWEANVIYENLRLVLLFPRRVDLSPLCFKDYVESVLCFDLEIQLSLEKKNTPRPFLSFVVETILDGRGQSGHTGSVETS